MKKLILLLLTIVTIQNVSYASFPVLYADMSFSLTITDPNPVDDADKAAKISMILAGIAVLFNLLAFGSSGFATLIPIFFAAIFYVAAFIFGLIGLRSKSKKWQAYIGLLPGLLVLLFLLISTGSFGDPSS